MQPFKKGMIILWSGSIASIPSGWALCDGTNGTPNLENSFVVGAGDTYVVAATGGAANHTHDGTTAGHSHTLQPNGDVFGGGTDYKPGSDSVQDTFTTDAESSLPPYYALAYIMKL